ncbi:PH domain-containing protein [Bacillus cereus]|uniref:PH domain-containing protein n=1 Tax=Bacillus cereus TaxID=1396 RepID=UPI00084BF010|nr:PH domain-containing protein [Bacillus cereus]MCM3201841.1 PH domain-containing protein [Bacillus cereus]MDN4100394.1 PH domain-containing protein [Bacillus cereus]MEB9901149.1 PH domain-containing protein [Bacillus cereus]MEC0219371.1 PH domain-containing protein [Bacillus cereus]MEC2860619.1 PH domain-containing protein [Bacillus cereus]
MSIAVKYQNRIKQDLEQNERIIDVVAGRTAPTTWVMKLLPEISWLTKENMPMLLAITNQRLLVYKQQINSEIQLSIGIHRSDIVECKEANGVLNGAIQITLKENQSFKFVFKKERVQNTLTEINKYV